MAVQQQLDYSVEDYLAIEREAVNEKCEYVAGDVFAMTGASFRHNLINTNLVRRIGNQLEKGPCMAIANDMRVRIESADACTYPDFIALCETPSFFDDRTDTLTNPALIIEILSPSTATCQARAIRADRPGPAERRSLHAPRRQPLAAHGLRAAKRSNRAGVDRLQRTLRRSLREDRF
ncbi:Uma2 family endonuclease [Halochromatium salexigens]|nr:Uma2 family endonuclease [Halochromatium salexigens]